MKLLCRLIGHRWQYHGIPTDRRVCVTCGLREHMILGLWR